ncbi:Retrovirus-related Pol poly from transposon [Brachionus plicatilis]|uniref:Retrovirus-related Pol poly from transposon n=1 Tax=Brachionus plicatilis TaxID=10195 RepID=A0A3M7PX55_BRAPC|nr:Retrovirus-related Pol poly from transposon [Brachionus plicatilis]
MAVAMPMEPFDYGRNMDTLGSRWKRWLDKFELHITGNALTDEDMIKARFLTSMGDAVYDTAESLGLNLKDKTRKEIHEALTKHFNPEKSEVNEILKFRRALKHKDEPVNSYYLRLRDLSQHCGFSTGLDRELAIQFLYGCGMEPVHRKGVALTKAEFKLDTILDYARAYEKSERNVGEIAQHGSELAAKQSVSFVANKYSKHKGQVNAVASKQSDNELAGKVVLDEAEAASYLKYKKLVHLDICAITDDPKVHRIDEERDERLVGAELQGSNVVWLIDSGSMINIIDEPTYKQLKHQPTLKACTTGYYAYKSAVPFQMLGCFETTIKRNSKSTKASVMVVPGKERNLLGFSTSKALGLVTLNVNSVAEGSGSNKLSKDQLAERFPALFSGKIGCVKDVKVKLDIDESVKPTRQPQRPVPFCLREAVEMELLKQVDEGIIERVRGGHTPWVANLPSGACTAAYLEEISTERHVNMVASSAVPPAMTLDEVARATQSDDNLQVLIDLKWPFG